MPDFFGSHDGRTKAERRRHKSGLVPIYSTMFCNFAAFQQMSSLLNSFFWKRICTDGAFNNFPQMKHFFPI